MGTLSVRDVELLMISSRVSQTKISLVEAEKTCIFLLSFCPSHTPSFSTTQSVLQFLTKYVLNLLDLCHTSVSLSYLHSCIKEIQVFCIVLFN